MTTPACRATPLRDLALGWLLLCLLGTIAIAQDWPQFRGPAGDGHSPATDLPTQWGEDKNVVWKSALPGRGWSSPTLVGDRIYLTAAVATGNDQDALKADRSLRTLCINARFGDIVWNTEIFLQNGADAPKIHKKNSHASATPIVEGDRVYVHFGHMGTACLDLDGGIVWSTQELTYRPVHGNGGCPVLVDDKLVFSCDGGDAPFMAALDKYTGKLAWKTPRETDANKKFAFSTPGVFDIDGERQILSPSVNALRAYRPSDGTQLWHASYEGYSTIPKPIMAHGLVYVVTGYNRSSVFALKPGGSGDITDQIEWTIDKRAPHTPSLLVIGDEVYMVSDSGIATCADAKTGEIHWQERCGGKAFSASPIYADGHIYLQDEYGKSIVLRPGKTFSVAAENQLDGRYLSSYGVTTGALFIRSDTHLYRIGK